MNASATEPAWAITHLRRIAVRCSAFDECVDYYAGPWGLRQLGDSDDKTAVLRATGAEHHVLELHRADRNGIDHISFGLADNGAVDAAAATLAGRGVTLLSEPAALDRPGAGYGFRIADPESRIVELAACTEAAAALRADATPTKIAHVVLNTADIEALCDWWCEVLGFRVSDWSERQMVFLRCNADHHAIAFNRAEWASLNHVAYEVPSLDAYMTSLGRLARAGHAVGWAQVVTGRATTRSATSWILRAPCPRSLPKCSRSTRPPGCREPGHAPRSCPIAGAQQARHRPKCGNTWLERPNSRAD